MVSPASGLYGPHEKAGFELQNRIWRGGLYQHVGQVARCSALVAGVRIRLEVKTCVARVRGACLCACLVAFVFCSAASFEWRLYEIE